MNLKFSKAIEADARVLPLCVCLTFLLLGNASCAANGFPGPIATLIELYSRADVVIYAEVVKAESGRAGQTSKLKILSEIKTGKRKLPTEIDAYVQFGSHWPRPFKANTKTVTFLVFDEELKKYVTIDSRTGLDVSDDSVGKFYVQQFSKLPQILEEKNKRKLMFAKIGWYVELTLRPPSRAYGAFGITSGWASASRKKLLTEHESQSAANLLTKDQKDLICQTLAKEAPSYSGSRIVDLLKDYPSDDLNHYLIQSFKRSLMFDSAIPIVGNSIARKAFSILPKRLGFEMPKSLQGKYDDFLARRSFYTSKIHNKKNSGYSDEEKAKIHDALVRLWRDLATSYLNIPEVPNFKRLYQR